MQTKFRWRVSSVTRQLLIHHGLSIETRTFLSQIILLLLHSLVSQSVKSIVIFLYQRHVAIHRLLSNWTRIIFALRKANICCGGRAKRDYEEFEWMEIWPTQSVAHVWITLRLLVIVVVVVGGTKENFEGEILGSPQRELYSLLLQTIDRK